MSGNPYVPDAATRAHEKAASKEARRARQDFVAGFSKIIADLEARLAAAGITVDDEPEPDMTGIPVVDYGRRVEMTTVMPVNVAAVQAISEVYASEAALINNTVRAVQEYQQLFCQGPEDPPLFASAQEQALMIQAFVDHQREETDDVIRKSHALYHAGPPATHRVLRNHEHEDLLQDWVKKRGPPNLLEIAMLSEYMGVDNYVLYDWFKAKGLQTQYVDLMMGEALSRNKKWRKIGLLRYRAAKVQTNWSLRLAWLRKQHRKSEAEQARNEAKKDRSGKTGDENAVGTGDDRGSKMDVDECEWDSDESDADVTMADVRGDMDPFIDEGMD